MAILSEKCEEVVPQVLALAEKECAGMFSIPTPARLRLGKWLLNPVSLPVPPLQQVFDSFELTLLLAPAARRRLYGASGNPKGEISEDSGLLPSGASMWRPGAVLTSDPGSARGFFLQLRMSTSVRPTAERVLL